MKPLLVGKANKGDDDFATVRYNPDGSLDLSFNGTGKVFTSFGSSNDSAKDVAIQSDGKILLGGNGWNTSTGQPNFAVVRYNSDGTLDTTFSDDGKVTTNIDAEEAGEAIALQSDGRILLGGHVRIGISGPDDADFAIIRYQGGSVPEPCSSVLAASMGALLFTRRTRRRMVFDV